MNIHFQHLFQHTFVGPLLCVVHCAMCYFKWSFSSQSAAAGSLTTRHLPHMDDSAKKKGFKLRKVVGPFYSTRKSSGMGDRRRVNVEGGASEEIFKNRSGIIKT